MADDVEGEINELGSTTFEEALGSCGNAGQEAIIEMMGVDCFIGGAWHAFYGSYVGLDVFCSHPEAVYIILGEADDALISGGEEIAMQNSESQH